MLSGEIRSIAIATVAAAVLVPLIGKVLSRVFPPDIDPHQLEEFERHRRRNAFIEYAGVAFLILGAMVPFWAQGKDSLQPTVQNIVLVLSFAILSMIGGIVLLTRALGDRGGASFLAYLQRQRGINGTGTLWIARALVIGALVALLSLLLKN